MLFFPIEIFFLVSPSSAFQVIAGIGNHIATVVQNVNAAAEHAALYLEGMDF